MKAGRNDPKPARPDDPAILEALRAGMGHHQAGRLARAEAIYRQVLEASPDHPDAMVLLGALAQRAGRPDLAADLIGRAIRIAPSVPDYHVQLGSALHGQGRLDEAVSSYLTALRLRPEHAETHLNLGNALHAQGKRLEAMASYRSALAVQPDYAEAHNNIAIALHEEGKLEEAASGYRAALSCRPDFAEGHNNLGNALLQLGEAEAALASYRRALEIDEQPRYKANLGGCIAAAHGVPADANFRDLLARAISEPWARPAHLARAAARLVTSEPALKAYLDAALRAWPARLTERELLGAAGLATLSGDRLLRSLLENAHVCDWDLERFLTMVRQVVLDAALAADAPADPQDPTLGFCCALARQCFHNDFVFCATDEELGRAGMLRERLAAAMASGSPVPALWLAAVGAYFPLWSVPSAATLLNRSWPQAVGALLAQQVAQPLAERQYRDAVAKLTPVADGVSRSVQRQYEENPYPRWVKLPPAAPLSLDAHLRGLFPLAPFRPLGKGASLDILVAGCGTGQESIETARQFPGARVLAVDLSLASLCYAERKAHELGLANIKHAQADITRLASIGRSFDVVSSVGVLHHLEDPMAGWRELVALLRPDGVMLVGLYSERARRAVVAAREIIAARGYGSTPQDIRRCRQDLISSGTHAELASLGDFYGTNECRDLLFHVQEHRFSLPRVKEMLQTLGLDFLGFSLDAGTLRRYRRRFPQDAAASSLERWDDFETEFPDTFAGMYVFWTQKREGR